VFTFLSDVFLTYKLTGFVCSWKSMFPYEFLMFQAPVGWEVVAGWLVVLGRYPRDFIIFFNGVILRIGTTNANHVTNHQNPSNPFHI